VTGCDADSLAGVSFSPLATLLEAGDPVSWTKYGLYWNDLIDMKTVPVVDDAQMIAALK
jgi:hypothetical protein